MIREMSIERLGMKEEDLYKANAQAIYYACMFIGENKTKALDFYNATKGIKDSTVFKAILENAGNIKKAAALLDLPLTSKGVKAVESAYSGKSR